jgi:hypothetical protein
LSSEEFAVAIKLRTRSCHVFWREDQAIVQVIVFEYELRDMLPVKALRAKIRDVNGPVTRSRERCRGHLQRWKP